MSAPRLRALAGHYYVLQQYSADYAKKERKTNHLHLHFHKI